MVAAGEQGNDPYFRDYFHQIRETLGQWEDLVACLDAYARFVGYDPPPYMPSIKGPLPMATSPPSAATGSNSSQARTSTPLPSYLGPTTLTGPAQLELGTPSLASNVGPIQTKSPSPQSKLRSPRLISRSPPPKTNYPPQQSLLQPPPIAPRDLELSKGKRLVKARLDGPPHQPYMQRPLLPTPLPSDHTSPQSRIGKRLKKLRSFFR